MEQNQEMKVSIIICTFHRANLLKKTLEHLMHVKHIEQAEIIVIDNNSPDHTAQVVYNCIERLQELDIRYVFESNQGLSFARNRGIQESNYEIIAFLDDDALPTKDWMISIIRGFTQFPDASALGGVIHPNFEGKRPSWLIKELELPYTIVNLGNRAMEYPAKPHPFGANMAIKKEVFDMLSFPVGLGRKGESLLSGEETWLFNRMRKKKMKLYYIPDMIVYHFISKRRLTTTWIRERYYYQGISQTYASKGLIGRSALIATTLLKQVYVSIKSIYVRSEGEKLLNLCRQESIKGTWGSFRTKGENS